MNLKRPMLAAQCEDISKLKYPILVSPKLDGFRCIKINGKALSRSFKPIANNNTRYLIETAFPDGIDGELMLADTKATFNDISSAFRKFEGEPTFVFHVFDLYSDLPFNERYQKLKTLVQEVGADKLQLVPHSLIENEEQLLEKEAEFLSQGFEGIMIRSVSGPYKEGRSTEKEGYLLKLKRFVDAEAEIIGMVEQMHNNNVKEENELGLSKRATKKENMIPAGTLGAFQVRDRVTGVEFEIGTGDGLTQELRKEIWENKIQYMGQLVKYKSQPTGVKDKPRFPVWLGFRGEEDL